MATNEESYENLNTLQDVVSSFCEFLTVAIHTILFEREIYPRSSFISARKYNFAVRQNRHPNVCQWIQDAVAAVESEVLNGNVDRIALVIYSAMHQPLERFMFDVSKLPSTSPKEIAVPFEINANPVTLVNLNEQLRATMSKLTTCGSTLAPIPTGCSFTVCMELKNKGLSPLEHTQSWIPVQPSLQAHSIEDAQAHAKDHLDSDLGGIRTIPVRTVQAGEMVFEAWIEEGKAKIPAVTG